MDMGRALSPLRYPGGKGQMYDYVVELMYRNDLIGSNYIEPFAGGAGVALKLLKDGYVANVSINDYDRSIYAFWYSILNWTEDFIRRIEETEVSINEWHIQKNVQINKEDAELFDLGFSTFFLNRTNRSGILKAGPIGGLNQQGKYKIDCRYNKERLVQFIRQINQYRNNIEISNVDANEFIRNTNKEESFWFIDPPYYHKGKDLYINFFTHEDHQTLSETIDIYLERIPFIITYDICDSIFEFYKHINCEVLSLNYSVQTKKKSGEYMFYKNVLV
ncbi:DNA adenine methylase [Paenibacillus sp. 1-18]|uniref:DNA adenine methylase n=1 Tax=Paenibacillus sp. 1-18 TaxID=1333846 RepID=UPI001E61FAC6|nr:DNA adenine methylase [Paenibacillus sp. 1-18]